MGIGNKGKIEYKSNCKMETPFVSFDFVDGTFDNLRGRYEKSEKKTDKMYEDVSCCNS